jgi:beta-lactam-binding protein with PASTA domain
MPTMPNVVGLEYQAAQASLQSAGVLVLGSIGYFGTFPVTPVWQKSTQPPNIVLTQSVSPGSTVSANVALTLGLSQFPLGVASP